MRFLPTAIVVLGVSTIAAAQEPAAYLPPSSPASQGIPAAAILKFVERADQEIESLHGFVLLRHGRLVAEGYWSPYHAQAKHELYSLSKSFTSTAVGLAIAEGKLGLDDLVLKFFPEENPENPGKNLREMRIRDLLSMSTGHQSEPNLRDGKSTWTRTFLAQDVPHKPGTHFLYNTSATYMLSAIVQQQTGQTVLDYLRPRLFQPLGIEAPAWGASPQGVSLGGYGLSVRTRDIARLGQLMLQKGAWNGEQLVPAEWVALATARQVSNGSNPDSDWDQGYGFQFWRCRHGCYRGDGAFGQYCVVMPEQDAVLAITGGVKNMQEPLTLVWEELLPAMKAEALPDDIAAEDRLREKLASLQLPLQAGSSTSPLAKSLSRQVYEFDANEREFESLAFETPSDGADLVLIANIGGQAHRILCSRDRWVTGRAAWSGFPEQPLAACGAWSDDSTYIAKLCYCETPYVLTVRLKFGDGQVELETQANVAFGPTKSPPLKGRLQRP